jgi:tetratricopeptide (TPR) repeat protein
LTLALSRVVTQMPVLLVLVQRPALHEDEPLLPELYQMEVHHAIDLNELPPDAVTALVTNRLQAAVLPLALALIQAQAQGNPFFVEELVDALCEAGKLLQEPDGSWTLSDGVMQALQDSQCLVKDSDGEWAMAPGASLSAAELGIPDSVHGVVLSRLDRLSEEHKLTLKVASVIGRIFDVDVLAQVHPARPARDVLLNQIRIVEARDFTRLEMPLPRLTYIFKHSVTQEVAYGTLLDSQRQELHCAVGDALEELQPEAVEQMAYHYSHSGVRDKTLFYLDKAARKTQREYANETALAYYIQALALEERWEWRQGQVEILHTLGRRDEQQAALQELEGDSNTPVFVAAYLWGEYYEATGDYALAHTAVERALADCYERGDVLGQIRCLTRLGWIDYRQGDYEGASIRYTEALGLLKDGSALSDDASQVMVEALNGLGSVYQQQTTFDQAQACFEQALQVSRTTNHRKGEADALNNLGIIYRYQRNFADALARYQRALDIQRMIGDRSGEGASLGNMAQVIQETGDYGRASEFFTASLAIQQAIGNRWNEINDWNDLGVLYQELGEPDRAQECLEQGLRLGEEIGDEAGQAYIMVNLGLVAHDRGNLDEARKILADGLSLAQEQDDTYLVSLYHSYLAVVYLGMHALQDAITHAQTALALRRGLDLRLDTTYNLTTLAQAYMLDGDMESAVKYAHDALHILGECGGEGPEFPQRDYFLCAQVLDTSGDREASRQAMQAAYDLVMERATKITDPVLRQSFLERVAINRQVVQAGGAL